MANILLVDGKNTAYRALFASRSPKYAKRHPFTVWLSFTHVWIEKFKPEAVHVFWDCPKSEIWRKKVLNEYKDQRDKMVHYTPDVQDALFTLINAAMEILPNMGVRQYYRQNQECDDLIYSACKAMGHPPCADLSQNRSVIVVSSDSDFLQLQWSMPHVQIYLPKEGKLAEEPQCDKALAKSLSGDEADNVEGYRGIGPVKSAELAANPALLAEFLKTVDPAKLKRNLALIDLSFNPYVVSNYLYVLSEMAKPVKYDRAAVFELIMKHRVLGLMAEWSSLMGFKNLR